MIYFLYTIFFLSCILLIASVLLQPGKTDAGALFTSNISNSAFNPRGTTSVLAKFTIAAAIIFMLSALFISMPAFNGGVSVLSTTEEVQSEAAPSVTNDANISLDTNANTAGQAPANVTTNANTTSVSIVNSAASTPALSNTNANN